MELSVLPMIVLKSAAVSIRAWKKSGVLKFLVEESFASSLAPGSPKQVEPAQEE